MANQQRKYGWHRQKRDDFNLRYALPRPDTRLPTKSDLTDMLPDCWDQGQTSSCTAHGIAGALWAAQVRESMTPVMPSRLFLYYNEREMEGDPQEDDGAEILDGIKVCNRQGIVPETWWPFDESKVLTKPGPEVYKQAIENRIHFYAEVDIHNINQIKLALSHRITVVFGMDVYPYFESDEMAETGILKMPKFGETPIGGHCVLINGHDDSLQMGLSRNSWGINWGIKKGHFWIPYEYLTSQLCSDGQVIRMK